ncbi:MAG: addiction module protein [Bacteroidia bacterium]
MTKVIITLENRNDVPELISHLKNIKSIKSFDVSNEDDTFEIDNELLAELDRRSHEIEEHPEKSLTWEQIRTSIKNKHGF